MPHPKDRSGCGLHVLLSIKGEKFIEEFKKRKSEMLEFLNELQGCAVQLEKMNKGAKISSVAGSSVGAVGGALSIAGLALAPVTAGVSLALTITGAGLGVTSAVNSAVTTGTEIGVKATQKKRANEILQNFMKGVQSFHDCLEGVASQPVCNVKVSKSEVAIGVSKIAAKAGTFGKGIDSFVDAASAVKMLQREEQIISSAGKVLAQEGKTLRNVPRVASDVPEMGIGTAQAAVKGPLALSKTMRDRQYIRKNIRILLQNVTQNTEIEKKNSLTAIKKVAQSSEIVQIVSNMNMNI
uniref:Uncharacterized protein n=1 Tax=Neolamprologus brichardi TaxID=32507 RepID=A0A3Q4GNF6_NEOBR